MDRKQKIASLFKILPLYESVVNTKDKITVDDYLSYLDSSGYIININGYLINKITPIVCGLSLFSTLATNGGVIDVRGGIYFDKSLKILARSMDTNIKVAYCYDLL